MFVYEAALALTLVTLLIALLWRAILWLRKRRPVNFWRRTLLLHAGLYLFHLCITLPVGFDLLLLKGVQTRGDERRYFGPRIGADGAWLLQSRESLKSEREGTTTIDLELARAAAERAVTFLAADGVPLRAFLVPPRAGPPRFVAVLAHGLFRGGLELEPVGSMLRDLGGEVLLLESRNHGGSGAARPTFGKDEAQDVEAAVKFMRERPEARARPLVLFGVSLGSAAVALAAPHVPDLAALILDAPIEELHSAAEGMLADSSGRRPSIGQPTRALLLLLAQWTGTIDFAAVRPIEQLRKLPPALPVLLIGEELDHAMPPAAVERMLAAVSADPAGKDPKKRIWICPGATHGKAWVTDPQEYQKHLEEFLAVALPPGN